MRFLKESSTFKSDENYYSVSRDGANYYRTLTDAINDLENFIPYGEDTLDEDDKVIIYSLKNIKKDSELTESDLGYDDEVIEFYDNKLHYFHTGRVVPYTKRKARERIVKTYTLLGSDNKYYDVKAYSKLEAIKTLRNYLKGK